jgi:ABC-type transporter lipoprotein component MlaA
MKACHKFPFFKFVGFLGVGPLIALLLALCTPVCAQEEGWAHTTREDALSFAGPELPRFKPIGDPWERMNRSFGVVNHGFMMGIINPTSKLYRLIIPTPGRDCIRKAGKNIAYPVRLINNLLQGKYRGAKDETARFGINTTVGLLGLFDPASSRWDIDPSEEDFGQTFGKWGWDPERYLLIPLIGPSNVRDALGRIGDTLANPATYIFGASLFFGYNELTYTIDPYKRFVKEQYDPYSIGRDVYTLMRKQKVVDYSYKKEDTAALQTLQAVFLAPEDDEFYKKAKTRSVRLSTTEKKFPYSLWIQPKPAPIAFILPGLGGHRLGNGPVALAEMVYKRGFSAVTVSSSMNWEFMKYAATTELPGFAPLDARDMHVALDTVYQDLQKHYPERVMAKALMGESMGGVHTLYIAAYEKEEDNTLIDFDRYAAIDAPVDLLYGLKMLDSFYKAPLTWNAATRMQQMDYTLMKAVELADGESLEPGMDMPFSDVEAKYVIGLVFRWTLRDAIYSSQKRNNLGIFKNELKNFKREPAYEEIVKISYEDYYHDIISPYYLRKGKPTRTINDITYLANVENFEEELKPNKKVRIFLNKNDFLLTREQIDWLGNTFRDGRIETFTEGGHLGNVHKPQVQERIMKSLEDLVGK